MRVFVGGLALVAAAPAWGQTVEKVPPEPAPALEPPAPPALPPASAPDHAAVWSPDSAWRPTGAAAEEDEAAALANLLDMSATVATKNATRVSRSPGMITVYGDQEIRRLGYYSLAELADVTAGYSSQTVYGERVFESRGQKAGSFNNNKHLILIDGIPVNHARGNKAMIDHNFPLFFANRVEFLRGPASALYGTGAFFGVVNVAPKELENRGFRAEARAGLGTEQADKRVAANALYRDGVRRAAIYAGFYDKGPSAAFTGSGRNPDQRFWDNQRSEFLYLTYRADSGRLLGLKGGFLYSAKNGGLGEHWLGGFSPEYDDLTWTQIVPYLKYDRRLTRTLSIDGYLKLNRDSEKATAAVSRAAVPDKATNLVLLYSSSVSVYEGLAELRWDPSPVWNVIGGVNVNFTYQNDGTGNYGGMVSTDPSGPAFRPNEKQLTSHDVFQTYSGFAQVSGTFPVLSGLHLTAGARLDAGQALDAPFAQLSPRVGVVQELTGFLGVKLLYHTALRAPGIKELGLNKETRDQLLVPGEVADVSPETIRSAEAGLVLSTGRVSAHAAAFVSETRDALNGRPALGNDGNLKNIFVNTPGTVLARGLELELTLARTPDARIFANYAYARATLRPEVRVQPMELADVPIHKANLGASYRIHHPLDLTATVATRLVSAYRPAPVLPPVPRPSAPTVDPPADPPPAAGTGDLPPTAAVPTPSPRSQVLNTGPETPGHVVVDANLIARLTENLGLELMLRNATATTYHLPQAGIPYIPMPARSVHLTLDYRW